MILTRDTSPYIQGAAGSQATARSDSSTAPEEQAYGLALNPVPSQGSVTLYPTIPWPNHIL